MPVHLCAVSSRSHPYPAVCLVHLLLVGGDSSETQSPPGYWLHSPGSSSRTKEHSGSTQLPGQAELVFTLNTETRTARISHQESTVDPHQYRACRLLLSLILEECIGEKYVCGDSRIALLESLVLSTNHFEGLELINVQRRKRIHKIEKLA